MVTVGDVYDFLDGWAPFATQASFDNAGLLVGSRRRPVRAVGVALDVTGETLEGARDAGCDLMVSHHPVIFQPVRRLPDEGLPARLLAAGIAVISAHTNLDAADGGVNDMLARRLELSGVEKLADPHTPALPPLARMGLLPFAMSAAELAGFVKDKLEAGGVRYTVGGDKITKVAVCGGAGADDFMEPAMAAGCGALITGEAKHHQLLAAGEAGFCLVDGSHFSTEQLIKEELARRIGAAFPALRVAVLEEAPPARYI